MIRFITINDKEMSNGQRNTSKTPLTDEEINFIKSEINRIQADPSVFIFNDRDHIQTSTCYNFVDDKIYVTRNVFPDLKYSSAHPRDIMSVGAVLAHEYYGHRTYRDEYINDYKKSPDFHTTPYWQDECRASITAAKLAPNLTEKDKSNLVMDAIYRAQEYNHHIEMDAFMKEVVYGYTDGEKNITHGITPIKYISQEGEKRTSTGRNDIGRMSEMRRVSKDFDDFER